MFDIKLIEIVTPGCTKCRQLKPKLDKLIKEYNLEFNEYTLGIDDEAEEYLNKYNLKQAPSFIIFIDNIESVIEFENIEAKISKFLRK